MTPPRSPEPSGSSLASELRRVAAVLEQVPADAPVSVQGEAVELLASVVGRLDAHLACWTAAFDANTGWAADGARSASGWLGRRTELSKAHAGSVVASGRDLRSCPHVAAAWSSGLLGSAKVRLLLAARKADPDRFAEHEEGLVRSIALLTVAHASVVIGRWEAIAQATKEHEDHLRGADAEPDEPPADPADDNRLRVARTLDGRVVGEFDLDPVAGTTVLNSLAAHIDGQFHAGVARADDGISLSKRQADALTELLAAGSKPGRTVQGEPRPSVAITIDAQTLAGLPARSLADALSRRCELTINGQDTGIAVSPATAERLLCTARVSGLLTRIAADGSVETVGITDLLRDATRRQRKALAQRDGGCVFPGCTAPPDWCQAHHVVPANPIDGPTLLHNLVFLCSHHHHLVHEGGWRLWREPEGTLHLARPDRTVLALTPHGAKTTGDPPHRPPPVPPPLPARVRFTPRCQH